MFICLLIEWLLASQFECTVVEIVIYSVNEFNKECFF
jgi:hypothetical protein